MKYYELLNKQSTTNIHTSSVDAMGCQLLKNEEDLQIIKENEQTKENNSINNLQEANYNKDYEDLDNEQLLGPNYFGDKVCNN